MIEEFEIKSYDYGIYSVEITPCEPSTVAYQLSTIVPSWLAVGSCSGTSKPLHAFFVTRKRARRVLDNPGQSVATGIQRAVPTVDGYIAPLLPYQIALIGSAVVP